MITNKFYIGMHSTSNLEDSYLGSGKILKRSINKHGKENHMCEILEFLESRELLKERERIIVNEELINEKLCMNLMIGGHGGWNQFNEDLNLQKSRNIKSQLKIQNLKKNDVEWKSNYLKKVSEGQLLAYKEGRKEYGIFYNWTSKKHKPETIEKMKGHTRQSGSNNSQYGTCWIYNTILKENKKIKKEDIQSYLDNGWIKGMKRSFNKK
jgi:hypothetical protein